MGGKFPSLTTLDECFDLCLLTFISYRQEATSVVRSRVANPNHDWKRCNNLLRSRCCFFCYFLWGGKKFNNCIKITFEQKDKNSEIKTIRRITFSPVVWSVFAIWKKCGLHWRSCSTNKVFIFFSEFFKVICCCYYWRKKTRKYIFFFLQKRDLETIRNKKVNNW